MNFSEGRTQKAKNIDTEIARVKKNQSRRLKSVGEGSDTLDNQLKQLTATRQTLPPVQNAEDYTFPVENGRTFHPTAGMSGIYNDDTDVAFWAGSDLTGAIWTAMNPFIFNPPQGQTIAPFVVTHGGTVIANQAIIRGNIYAEDGVFSGTVFASDGEFNGKITSNKDGNRIIIDPNTRSLSLYRGSDVISSLGFTVTEPFEGVTIIASALTQETSYSSGNFQFYDESSISDTGLKCERNIDRAGLKKLFKVACKPNAITIGKYDVNNPDSQLVGLNVDILENIDGENEKLTISLLGLPTDNIGLRTGQIWNDNGTLKIVS